jgi:hypothetical protein
MFQGAIVLQEEEEEEGFSPLEGRPLSGLFSKMNFIKRLLMFKTFVVQKRFEK